jgi:hypothetical protein
MKIVILYRFEQTFCEFRMQSYYLFEFQQSLKNIFILVEFRSFNIIWEIAITDIIWGFNIFRSGLSWEPVGKEHIHVFKFFLEHFDIEGRFFGHRFNRWS